MPVFRLNESLIFPQPQLARGDGLLAIGGDLRPERLLLAYRSGIFPWYGPDEPILWWAPDPRLVLFPGELRISRRLARTIRQRKFQVSIDRDFAQVINQCASTRQESGTWLNPSLIKAFCCLHEMGYAHSVECWLEGKLVGGLYGMALDKVFFGESMFCLVPDSSKVALAGLVAVLKKRGFGLIDCQVRTDHMLRLGAREIPGNEFYSLLTGNICDLGSSASWYEELVPGFST